MINEKTQSFPYKTIVNFKGNNTYMEFDEKEEILIVLRNINCFHINSIVLTL